MTTASEALEWIRKQRIALEAAKVGAVPSLAHQIVRGPISGSWWGHPSGKLIFTLATALHDSGEVLVLKLIDGKTTYVHVSLWPALLRVLLDSDWRAPRIAALPASTQGLLMELERRREVGRADPRAVKELELKLLARVTSEHTDKGHHQKRLTAWAHWSKAAGVKPWSGSLAAALLEVRAAAHGAGILG
jgi:hypothetical protein